MSSANLIISVAILLGLVGCAESSNSSREAMLVGIWESNTATGSSIIFRKSDRTFLEKKIQKYDYSKPPISYSTQGEWKVNGNYYIFTAKYFSIPLWQNAIDKPKKVEITEITPIVFNRLSTDGANI